MSLGEQIKIANSDIYSNWLSVSNGATHAAAVKSNGRLFTWGVGLCGQLGQNIKQINKI